MKKNFEFECHLDPSGLTECPPPTDHYFRVQIIDLFFKLMDVNYAHYRIYVRTVHTGLGFRICSYMEFKIISALKMSYCRPYYPLLDCM
jgi:hypothetical protein